MKFEVDVNVENNALQEEIKSLSADGVLRVKDDDQKLHSHDDSMSDILEECADGDTTNFDVLKKELDNIVVNPPELKKPEDVFDLTGFPLSYKNNLPKEKLVLQYAENFRLQYVHLYRDRKPLFLNPLNECQVEKFVCTTIRPTQLLFKDLLTWHGAAEFVADYLDIELLESPYDLPTRLLSPSTVLQRRKGNCFEYSILLCSLLIAAGYDAYIVNGYADRETCLADETRSVCSLMQIETEEKCDEAKKEIRKYTARPSKDLRSKFILKMEARKISEEKAYEKKWKIEDELRILELEKPPPDPLYGLRVHAWILVLSGKCEVPENFFIEPLTGLSHPVRSTSYLGIESLWNDTNYWVNMQDCSKGLTFVSYDLGDCTKWEFIFTGLDKPILQIPDVHNELTFDDEDEEENRDVERHLDMPPSWVEPLRLTQYDFEMRCPEGKKVKVYRRAKLEKYARYLLPDGLHCRLSIFDNMERYMASVTELVMVKEYFEHRKDKLHARITNHRSGWVMELFHPGRSHYLIEHRYKAGTPGAESERSMAFYSEARVDGLEKRIETPTEMTECFVGREDMLHYKHIEFGRRPKKFGPQDEAVGLAPRPITKMVVRYHRNESRQSNCDMRQIEFLVSEDKVLVTYHTDKASIAASTREFLKPHNWDEKGATLSWSRDMHSTYQVDPFCKPCKQLTLYEMLLLLLQEEEKAREAVRESEEEVQNILDTRNTEEINPKLEVSLYDMERNEKGRNRRKMLEAQLLEEARRKQETEMDYLAPFLAKISDPEKISKQQAYSLKEDCLTDLKQRLINKANLIQARFEKETQDLQKKQSWYQQNQISMSKDDEEDYLDFCSVAMFRIHILELRLNRHKESAPHKYMALEQKLRNDPRLAEYFY